MALPVGPVNNKAAIILTSEYQPGSFQPFIGPGSQAQGWHHFADDKPNNTICFFLISSGSSEPLGNASGEVFFSKEPTVVRAYYDRGPTYYTVNVNTYSEDLGVYYAWANGTNSGAINPDTQIGIGAWNTLTAQQVQMFADVIREYTPDDPYSPGGTAGPGGGGGTYTISSDPVPFPTLPTISVADAGFVSIWVPNLTQLQDLANFMWNADPTKIDFWKKLIANPMELILGLHLLPFHVPTETLPASVTMGFIDTGIEMFYTDQQFHEIDCGTLDVEEFWGAFLDYAPYTQLDIYLPFIGVRSLNINDCMPKTIALKYIVDIVTGSCVAILKCDDAVFYHFSGSCASEVPVTASQMQEIVKAAFSLVTTVASAAATGGVAGALTAGAVGASSAIANTGQHASRSGTIGGTTGFMSVQTPYLILTRPRQAMPEDQQTYTGYPSFITMEMSELEGYTEIEVTHLHGMSCTSAECDEIMRLLGEGVIF